MTMELRRRLKTPNLRKTPDRNKLKNVRKTNKKEWTIEETEAFNAGLEEFGPGKWKKIKNDSKYCQALAERTGPDLKDKYRNMTTRASTRSRLNGTEAPTTSRPKLDNSKNKGKSVAASANQILELEQQVNSYNKALTLKEEENENLRRQLKSSLAREVDLTNQLEVLNKELQKANDLIEDLALN